jgi:hypothetical protein
MQIGEPLCNREFSISDRFLLLSRLWRDNWFRLTCWLIHRNLKRLDDHGSYLARCRLSGLALE